MDYSSDWRIHGALRYLVAHGATSPTSTEMWMLGDQVYLARVTPTVANIGDKTKWEFYAGGHGKLAKWVTGDVSAAKPLVEFANHTGEASCCSITMVSQAGPRRSLFHSPHIIVCLGSICRRVCLMLQTCN